ADLPRPRRRRPWSVRGAVAVGLHDAAGELAERDDGRPSGAALKKNACYASTRPPASYSSAASRPFGEKMPFSPSIGARSCRMLTSDITAVYRFHISSSWERSGGLLPRVRPRNDKNVALFTVCQTGNHRPPPNNCRLRQVFQ